MESDKILIVFPTLDEEDAISSLIFEVPAGVDVLVVDSGSSDETVERARKAGASVIDVAYGRGQGSGLRTGMEYFLQKGLWEYIVWMDADNTDCPSDIQRVIEKLKEGNDLVLGIRDFEKQRRILGSFTIFAKGVSCYFMYLCTGYKVRDILSGYWGLKKDAVEKMLPHLTSTSWEWNFEFMKGAWMVGLKVSDADVGFRPRVGRTKLGLFSRVKLIFFGVYYFLEIEGIRLLRSLKLS